MRTANEIGDSLEGHVKDKLGGRRVKQSGGGSFWKLDVRAGTFVVSCKATGKSFLRVTAEMAREARQGARGVTGTGNASVPAIAISWDDNPNEAWIAIPLNDFADLVTAEPGERAYIPASKAQERLARTKRSL